VEVYRLADLEAGRRGPGLGPLPKLIFTTGAPSLPVHTCAFPVFARKKIKQAMQKYFIAFDKNKGCYSNIIETGSW
jgi:hypothetical protein